MSVRGIKMAINYGLNRVRFIAAVPSGGRIRARSELVDAAKVDDNTVNMTVKHTIELDGSDKPAAVAETIVRVLFQPPKELHLHRGAATSNPRPRMRKLSHPRSTG